MAPSNMVLQNLAITQPLQSGCSFAQTLHFLWPSDNLVPTRKACDANSLRKFQDLRNQDFLNYARMDARSCGEPCFFQLLVAVFGDVACGCHRSSEACRLSEFIWLVCAPCHPYRLKSWSALLRLRQLLNALLYFQSRCQLTQPANPLLPATHASMIHSPHRRQARCFAFAHPALATNPAAYTTATTEA